MYDLLYFYSIFLKITEYFSECLKISELFLISV